MTVDPDPLVEPIARTIWRTYLACPEADQTVCPAWATQAAETIAAAIGDTVVSYPEATARGIIECLEEAHEPQP